MDGALLTARLLLAAVFTVAALAKLGDRRGAAKSAAQFGVPQALVAPLIVFLPLFEIATAALLVPQSSAWWGALSALSLLIFFAAVIAVTLIRGRSPDCHCFGQLHSEPAGWRTLLRNGILTAVAGFVVWQGSRYPGPSAVAWLGALSTIEVVLLFSLLTAAAIVAVQGWFVVQLFRQHGRLLLRIDAVEHALTDHGVAISPEVSLPVAYHGLPIGTPAPAFSLPELSGQPVSLEGLVGAGHPALLVFVDPACGACIELGPDASRWQQHNLGKLSIVLVSRGTADENRIKFANVGTMPVLLQKDSEVAVAYQAHGTPAAVAVGADRRIASRLALGAEAISSLLERAARAPLLAEAATLASRKVIPIGSRRGEAVPLFELPNLAGEEISLVDFLGHRTALLFWDPACSHCSRMLTDLRHWEANRPDNAPKLLVISTGAVEANRALALRAPIMLDPAFAVGRSLGATGTPSAVLMSEEGEIVSDVAVGAAQVLGLLTAPALKVDEGYLRGSDSAVWNLIQPLPGGARTHDE